MKLYSVLLVGILFSLFSVAAPLPPISESDLQSRIEILNHEHYRSGATLKYTGENNGCAALTLKYPVKDPYSEKIYTYEMKFSWPHSSTPVPLIISVPTIKGITPLENSILKQTCKLNVAAIIAHVNNEEILATPDGLILADHQLMRGTVALRTLLDVIEDMPAVDDSSSLSHVLIDTKRIGMVGLSVGSVSSLLAIAVDDRIKALFTMGTVGNTPNALAFSHNSDIQGLKKAQMKHLGLKTPEQYEMYLRTQMTAVPVDFSSLLEKRSIYQVIIENDQVAPTEGQYELKSAVGIKKVYFNKGTFGHTAALVSEIIMNQFHLPRFIKTEL
jgi:hypothetical protein